MTNPSMNQCAAGEPETAEHRGQFDTSDRRGAAALLDRVGRLTAAHCHKHADIHAQLRLIGDRYRRELKELLKRAGSRPQTWRKA